MKNLLRSDITKIYKGIQFSKCCPLQNNSDSVFINSMYSEKATKFYEISTLLLTGTAQDKSMVEISQNFVAFLEYMNFKYSE